MRYDREVSHTMNLISVLFCLLLLLLLSVRHLHYKSFPDSLDWTFNYTWDCVSVYSGCMRRPLSSRVSVARGWLEMRWWGFDCHNCLRADNWWLAIGARSAAPSAACKSSRHLPAPCSLATMPLLSLSPEPEWQFHKTWSLSSHYDHFAVD